MSACGKPSVMRSIARRSSTICAAGWPPWPTACCRRPIGRTNRTSSCSITIPNARRPSSTRPDIAILTVMVRDRVCLSPTRPPASEFPRLQAAVIQQNLRDVGIDVDVRSYEFATLYADILKGNFQMYALQWVGGALADPDILRRVFHSQQVPPAGFNRGHFSDPEVDRLIDEASNATDYETRRAALRQGPAAACRGRAVHQPLASNQLRARAAGTPRHPSLAAGRLHVSAKRLAPE